MCGQKDEKMHHIWSLRVCADRSDKAEVSKLTKLIPGIYQTSIQRISLTPAYQYAALRGSKSIKSPEVDLPSHHNGMLKVRLSEVSLIHSPSYYYADVWEDFTQDSLA